jgi:hypothetical protein
VLAPTRRDRVPPLVASLNQRINALASNASALLRVEPKRLLLIAIAFHVACAIVLVPVTSHPYDLAVLTSNAQAWLRWGFSPLYQWKFGLDFAGLAQLAQALRAFLTMLHVPGIVALHIAWKLPLVAADVLTAGAIYRLGLKLAPDRAMLLAALWLVNPVILWVSAGHGQVESLAILCVFGALQLTLDRRLLLAGFITGLGTGVEYYPIAVLGVVLVWWRGGQLRGRYPLFTFGVGLAAALIVCFLPLIVDPVGRSSLLGGLASSGGLTSGSVNSLLTGWAWLGFESAGIWPVLFLISGVACFAVALRLAKRGPAVGLVFLAVVLMAALILDANTLPQFAAVAAAALWLLALSLLVQPVVLIAVPVTGIASYFVFLDFGASTANSFFYDDWYATGATLWPVPISPRAAVVLGHLFSLGLLGAFAWTLMRLRTAPKLRWGAGVGFGGALCVVLVIWSSQPALWNSALRGSPADNLPDFDYAAGARAGTLTVLGPNLFQATYANELVTAARQTPVQPTAGFRARVGALYSREDVGNAVAVDRWSDRAITVPQWAKFRSTSQSIWVRLLLGSPDWSGTEPPRTSDLSLHVGNSKVPATRAYLVLSKPANVGWAFVDFLVPSAMVDAQGRLDLLPSPESLVWNGSSQGPWVRITPASGVLYASVDQRPTAGSYEFDSAGLGYIDGFPIVSSYVANLDGAALPDSLQIEGAVVHWPQTPEDWKHDPWWQTLGALYGLVVLGATAWAVVRYLKSTPGVDGPRAQVANGGATGK